MRSTPLPDFTQDLGDGIYAIDTGFQRPAFDAAYLLVDDGCAAFIDTGTAYAVPRLLATLDALNLPRQAAAWVIPTHVHLDHAGGVGALMQALPVARLLVHPRGARHLIDPTALWQGALAVYGAEEMARSYGELLPVDPQRVDTSTDNMTLPLGNRMLMLAHTAGHARHHHCIWDPVTAGWFTGDTFGISYREFDNTRGAWILPSTTPVQFEPEVLRDSILRLLASEPRCMYLTHFGRVNNVQRLGHLLLEHLQAMVDCGQRVAKSPQRHQALKDGLLDLACQRVAEHGCDLPRQQVAHWLAMDIELNAQGLAIWLDRH